jgi:hypothetical protein
VVRVSPRRREGAVAVGGEAPVAGFRRRLDPHPGASENSAEAALASLYLRR